MSELSQRDEAKYVSLFKKKKKEEKIELKP